MAPAHSLLIINYSLLNQQPPYSLLIINYSLLNQLPPTHYSLLITHYSNGNRPLIIHY